MYSTAENVSSNDANKLHSKNMVDALLQSNGYDKRVLAQIKQKRKNKISQPTKKKNGAKNSTLKIPFLSDNCTTRIKRAAEKFKLPIRVVTTPGIKLKNVLTSSKPLDKPQCPNVDCKCCIAMENTSRCTDSNVIYHICSAKWKHVKLPI